MKYFVLDVRVPLFKFLIKKNLGKYSKTYSSTFVISSPAIQSIVSELHTLTNNNTLTNYYYLKKNCYGSSNKSTLKYFKKIIIKIIKHILTFYLCNNYNPWGKKMLLFGGKFSKFQCGGKE